MGKFELYSNVIHDRCDGECILKSVALCIFQQSFQPLSQSFVDSGAFLVPPPTSCKTRRLNEDSVSMLNNNVNHSLVVLILLFFMLLVNLDPRKGLTRIRLYCEVEYVILTSRNIFSQLFHSPLAEISNPALSVVFYSLSKSFLLIGRCVGSV